MPIPKTSKPVSPAKGRKLTPYEFAASKAIHANPAHPAWSATVAVLQSLIKRAQDNPAALAFLKEKLTVVRTGKSTVPAKTITTIKNL